MPGLRSYYHRRKMRKNSMEITCLAASHQLDLSRGQGGGHRRFQIHSTSQLLSNPSVASCTSEEKEQQPLPLSGIRESGGEPSSRVRVHSDYKSKRITRGNVYTSNDTGHYGHCSMLGFAGFDSFTEVRRGFKFRHNDPNFYLDRKPCGMISTASMNQ